MLQRLAEQFRIGLRIKLGHFGEPYRGLFPCVDVFAVRASGIILKNADGFRDVSVLDQFTDVGLHVARRNAPRLARKQHGALPAFRHRRPELLIQNFPVRLDEHPRVAHLVFVCA